MFPAKALRLHRASSLAVVGIVKNAGKTVAIGRLLRESASLGRVAGVLSTGLDGEPRDTVFGYRKPPVIVSEGMWVATAAQGIEAAEAGLAPRAETGVATPFGPVVVAEVVRAGRVSLIGPRSLSQVARVIMALRAQGVELVLVDGSVDRRAVAAAAETEAVVLVVGAAWSRDLASVVREARRVLAAFAFPLTGLGLADWPAAPDMVTRSGEVSPCGLASALGAEEALAALAAGRRARALRCPGAVSGALLDALVDSAATPLKLIAHDGTRVFATEAEIERFEAAGGEIEVRRPIRVAGVAINPYSPEGYRLPVTELRERIQDLVPGRPVFDALKD